MKKIILFLIIALSINQVKILSMEEKDKLNNNINKSILKKDKNNYSLDDSCVNDLKTLKKKDGENISMKLLNPFSNYNLILMKKNNEKNKKLTEELEIQLQKEKQDYKQKLIKQQEGLSELEEKITTLNNLEHYYLNQALKDNIIKASLEQQLAQQQEEHTKELAKQKKESALLSMMKTISFKIKEKEQQEKQKFFTKFKIINFLKQNQNLQEQLNILLKQLSEKEKIISAKNDQFNFMKHKMYKIINNQNNNEPIDENSKSLNSATNNQNNNKPINDNSKSLNSATNLLQDSLFGNDDFINNNVEANSIILSQKNKIQKLENFISQYKEASLNFYSDNNNNNKI